MLLFLVMVKLSNICPGYRGLEPLSGQTKDYKIGIWCFFAKHTTLRRKRKDLSARNQKMCPSGVETLLNWR